jgi:hypothetical protein
MSNLLWFTLGMAAGALLDLAVVLAWARAATRPRVEAHR